MKTPALLAAVACTTVAFTATAGAAGAATTECRGLPVCVPVAGPWVLATAARTEFQLDCPKRFVIGGLDAELSSRAVEIGFVGGLGSPVNPGITTTGSAVFLGRFVGASGIASFRPHIGCIPASGGGRRAPTAYRAFKPGTPTVRVVKNLMVLPHLTLRTTTRCGPHQRLVSATHAVGFFTDKPPSVGAARSVHVTQTVRHGSVHMSTWGGVGLIEARTVVQVDLVCAVGA